MRAPRVGDVEKSAARQCVATKPRYQAVGEEKNRNREGGQIHDLRGWLTTVTGRICLDVLKSARVSREAYPDIVAKRDVVKKHHARMHGSKTKIAAH